MSVHISARQRSLLMSQPTLAGARGRPRAQKCGCFSAQVRHTLTVHLFKLARCEQTLIVALLWARVYKLTRPGQPVERSFSLLLSLSLTVNHTHPLSVAACAPLGFTTVLGSYFNSFRQVLYVTHCRAHGDNWQLEDPIKLN